MSDIPQSQPPGWYYAQGDPPGTQRFWDGTKWEGGPQPVPGAPQSVTGAPPLAEPINRIGARIIDWIIWIIPSTIISFIFVGGAIAAGGTLCRDRRARAFWVLADAEGNEACICTWQDR